MSSGTGPTSKLYDKIIKRPSISHETIPLRTFSFILLKQSPEKKQIPILGFHDEAITKI
jgi:hypothetical protein